jgi:hypothetical protein
MRHNPKLQLQVNDESWIIAAMQRVLEMMRETELDTKLVSYGAPSRALLQMADEFGRGRPGYQVRAQGPAISNGCGPRRGRAPRAPGFWAM